MNSARSVAAAGSGASPRPTLSIELPPFTAPANEAVGTRRDTSVLSVRNCSEYVRHELYARKVDSVEPDDSAASTPHTGGSTCTSARTAPEPRPRVRPDYYGA